MSYCVNCGVELDPTATACPLCRTKIYNPNQPVATDIPTPYPTIKGVSEPVKKQEFTILMSIIFLTTSAVCMLLNLFILPYGQWSLYVTGICALLWIFLLPVFFPKRANLYLNLALNGISIALYLGFISFLHPGNGWYFHIALPITAATTLLLEIICIFAFHLKSSMIIKTVISVTAVAILCLETEAVIDYHLRGMVFLGWSAIVLTCCAAIDIILLTIYLQEGLRAELRRRMHF